MSEVPLRIIGEAEALAAVMRVESLVSENDISESDALQRHVSHVKRLEGLLGSGNLETASKVMEDLVYGWNGMPDVKEAAVRAMAYEQISLIHVLTLLRLEHYNGVTRVLSGLASRISEDIFCEAFRTFIEAAFVSMSAYTGLESRDDSTSMDLAKGPIEQVDTAASSNTLAACVQKKPRLVRLRPPSHKFPLSYNYLRSREVIGRPVRQNHVPIFRHAMVPPPSPGFEIDKYDSRVYAVRFTSDGRYLYTAHKDWEINFYAIERHGEVVRKHHTYQTHEGRWTLTDVVVSADNSMAVYSTILPSVIVANVSGMLHEGLSQAEKPVPHVMIDLHCPGISPIPNGDSVIPGVEFAVWSIDMSMDKREVCAGTSNNLLCIVDVERMQAIAGTVAHSNDVNSIKYVLPNNPHVIITGSDDCQLRLWDKRTPLTDPIGTFLGHTEGVTSVDSKGDGVYFISNSKDQKMKLWDIRAMRPGTYSTTMSHFWDYRADPYPADPRCVQHPHDTSVSTCIGHKVLKTLIKCKFSSTRSTGGKYFLSGSADGSVYVYDWEGRLVRELASSMVSSAGGLTIARDAAWHPDYPLVASAMFNGHVIGFGAG